MGASLVSGSPGRTTRSFQPLEIRATPEKGEGTFTAVVLQYNVRDDYNTEFAPGVFDESMRRSMPRIAWGHDWREVIGRWTDWKADGQRLALDGRLDLQMVDVTDDEGKVVNRFPAVPLAHQAYAQLQSGTVDEFSVGFMPESWTDVQDGDDWYRVFTKGRLDEVSIVLAGAVPGTKLLAVRSAGLRLHVREPLVSKEKVAAILVRLYSDELDLADALQELKNLPVEGDDSTPPPDPAADDTQTPPPGDESDETPPAGTDTPPDEDDDESDDDEDGSDDAAREDDVLAEASAELDLVASL
jgi:HK97 family phage prohead protease